MATGIERAFRDDAPRILGAVAHTTGDLQLAEEAVQEAFARALARARAGERIDNPAAWITTVARRIAVDLIRREQTAARAQPELAERARRTAEASMPDRGFAFTGDKRLELILLVCHPELTEEARLALALRFVCGVSTRDVARAMLVSEATMAARLTRAKKRIHDSPVRFALDDDAVAARMPDALAVIALLYTVGHAAPGAEPASEFDLRRDAIALARDAYRLRPGDPEAAGLAGLLLLTEARQTTRLDADGALVDLAAADRTRWDRGLMAEGEELATRALLGGTGRFALQAGIAGLHAVAPAWEATDWNAICRLYDGLVAVWPAPPARLGRWIARGLGPAGPATARAELDGDAELFAGVLAGQAYAARAELSRRLGAMPDAAADYRRALEHEENPRVLAFLEARLAEVTDDGR